MGCRLPYNNPSSLARRPQQVSPAQKADPLRKGGLLEQNAAASGGEALPPHCKIITKSGARPLDPVGEEPWNDADHVFHAPSREARVRRLPAWKTMTGDTCYGTV